MSDGEVFFGDAAGKSLGVHQMILTHDAFTRAAETSRIIVIWHWKQSRHEDLLQGGGASLAKNGWFWKSLSHRFADVKNGLKFCKPFTQWRIRRVMSYDERNSVVHLLTFLMKSY